MQNALTKDWLSLKLSLAENCLEPAALALPSIPISDVTCCCWWPYSLFGLWVIVCIVMTISNAHLYKDIKE
jgi:hypothetical protein